LNSDNIGPINEDICPKCGGTKFWQMFNGKMQSFCPCEILQESLNVSVEDFCKDLMGEYRDLTIFLMEMKA